MCSKKKFPTRAQADRAMGRMWSEMQPGKRLPIRCYKCPTCQNWHWTSQEKHTAA